MFRHILVPLDGTKCAELAIPLAARIARASGATLTLLSVIEASSASLADATSVGMSSQRIMDAERRNGLSYLSRMENNACLRDLPVEVKLCFGSWSGSLIENAEMEYIDLIVMYGRGGADIRYNAMGSVVQYISHHGPIPVLLLHDQEAPEKQNELRPFRLLVALDGSKRAEAAIRPAAMLGVLLSAPEPGNLHLLCIGRSASAAANLNAEETVKQTNEDGRKATQVYLENIKRKMFREIVYNFPLDISFSLGYGQDIPTILADLIKLEYTLVSPPLSAFALSIHDRYDNARCLLGSITEALLGVAHPPILAMQQAEGRTEKYIPSGRATKQINMR